MPIPIILLTSCLLALSACASPPAPDLSRTECRLDPAPLSCAAEMDAEARAPTR